MDANLRVWEAGCGQWDCATWWGNVQGKGSQEEQSGGMRRKGYKRVQSHTKVNQWVCLPGWVPFLTTAVCLLFLINAFLTLSLRNLTLSCVYVCCKDQVPATGETGVSGFDASYWSQTRDVGAPGLWYQLLEPVESQCSYWSQWGHSASYWSQWGLGLQPPGQEQCVSPNHLRGETGVRQVRGSELVAGVGPLVTAHMPDASCWEGQMPVSSPNQVCVGCACVFTSKLQAEPAGK